VKGLCTYADAIENEATAKENERGLKALVKSLKVYVKDFDELYTAVTNNENYENASRETVMKYYNETTVSS
jgi:intergrase/recombinase